MAISGAAIRSLAFLPLLAACSGGGSAATVSSPAPWSTVFVSTAPTLPVEIQMVGYRYIPNDIHVQAGKVVFYLVNPASETYAHNMVINDRSGTEIGRSPSDPPGTTAIFTVNRLPPGFYVFSSTLEGIGYSADGTQASHGMVGRLSVVPDYKANSSTVRSATRPSGAIEVRMADLRFDPSRLVVKAGRLEFYLVSPASEGLSHNMVITEADGRVVAVSAEIDPGVSAVFTVEYLAPGDYLFMSTLGGPDDPTQHYQADAGMVGTLTVAA